MSRKRRRADGTLRPSVARARARRRQRDRGAGFLPDAAVARFRSITLSGTVVWNAQPLRDQYGLDVVTLGAVLERLAGEHRWAKLRDTNGVVRAIGLPRNHPDRDSLTVPTHHGLMLNRIAIDTAVGPRSAA